MLIRILVLLAVAAPSWATTYTVGSGKTYATIGACISAMKSNGGDVCEVYAGTYSETPTLKAGQAGAYNVVQAHGTDTVYVNGFVAANHTKINGFHIQYPSAPNSQACVLANALTDVYITNNVLFECGNGSQIIAQNGASYIYIQGNTLSYGGVLAGAAVSTTGSYNPSSPNTITNVVSVGTAQANWVVYGTGLNTTEGVRISSISGAGPYTLTVYTYQSGGADPSVLSSATGATITLSPPVTNCILGIGHHFLIEGNDFSHYGLCIDLNASYTITRNNTFHDVYQAEAPGNSHTDFWYSEPYMPGNGGYGSQFNLVEGNSVRNAVGFDAKGMLYQNDGGSPPACPSCNNLIARFNTVSRMGGGFGSPSIANWPYIKKYNNTLVDLAMENESLGYRGDIDNAEGMTHASSLNSIYYFGPSATWPSSGFDVYGCGANCNAGNHLFYCAGSCGGGTAAIVNGVEATFASGTGNRTADPRFVNYTSAGSTSNNYHLQAGSPAIGNGTYLTTVSSYSGNVLTVADAAYFQDGYGLTSGDCIAVGATPLSNHACVTSVNYATNQLTLSGTITALAGQPVYLYSKSDGAQVLTGNTPDSGAFPYSATASPAVSLSATSHDFGSQMVGIQSAGFDFTVQNSGSVALSISSITPSGDFAESNNCPISPSMLGIGSNCTISVTFTPTQAGTRAGSILVSDDASGSPQVINLSGTGLLTPAGSSGTGISAGQVIIR